MQYSFEARGFASMANVRWSHGSIGSIGQAILRSNKYFTDSEMTLLQNAREHSLEARGFASIPNVRWSDGSIGSIGQAILRSDKYFAEGEMHSMSCKLAILKTKQTYFSCYMIVIICVAKYNIWHVI